MAEGINADSSSKGPGTSGSPRPIEVRYMSRSGTEGASYLGNDHNAHHGIRTRKVLRT